MRSEKAEMPSRTRILAREATAGGMLHLGVAVRRPPGLRDTTRVHQVGGRALPSEHRAHVAGKGPDSGLIEAMSRRGDVHSVEEAKNQATGTENEQKWRRGRDTRGDPPRHGISDAHAAGIKHPGAALQLGQAAGTLSNGIWVVVGHVCVILGTSGSLIRQYEGQFRRSRQLAYAYDRSLDIGGFLYNKHAYNP